MRGLLLISVVTLPFAFAFAASALAQSPPPGAPSQPGGFSFSATIQSGAQSGVLQSPFQRGWWYYGWAYGGTSSVPYANDPPETSRKANVPQYEGAHVRRLRTLPRPSSSEARERAKKYLTAGDELFVQGRFLPAVERYRAAARAATDLAEPHMLQGLALVAHGNYAAALASFRRGLELQSDWSESTLSLEEMYSAPMLKVTNDRLQEELARTPLKPDLLVAFGMQLYFSGQRDRAATYLSQAASLKALDSALLEPFLQQPALAQQSDADPK